MSRSTRAARIADILEALDARIVSDFPTKKSRKRTRGKILKVRASLAETLNRMLSAYDDATRAVVEAEAYALIEQRRGERVISAIMRRERAEAAELALAA